MDTNPDIGGSKSAKVDNGREAKHRRKFGNLRRQPPLCEQRPARDDAACPSARHTVHEMARDEARHGVALKGMLERYFK